MSSSCQLTQSLTLPLCSLLLLSHHKKLGHLLKDHFVERKKKKSILPPSKVNICSLVANGASEPTGFPHHYHVLFPVVIKILLNENVIDMSHHFSHSQLSDAHCSYSWQHFQHSPTTNVGLRTEIFFPQEKQDSIKKHNINQLISKPQSFQDIVSSVLVLNSLKLQNTLHSKCYFNFLQDTFVLRKQSLFNKQNKTMKSVREKFWLKIKGQV